MFQLWDPVNSRCQRSRQPIGSLNDARSPPCSARAAILPTPLVLSSRSGKTITLPPLQARTSFNYLSTILLRQL